MTTASLLAIAKRTFVGARLVPFVPAARRDNRSNHTSSIAMAGITVVVACLPAYERVVRIVNTAGTLRRGRAERVSARCSTQHSEPYYKPFVE